MTVATVAGTCGKADCLVVRGGACLLGHTDPLDCEAFEPSEPGEETADDESSDPETDPDAVVEVPEASPRGRVAVRLARLTVALHTGEALTAREATRVLQRTSARVVVPVGPVDVGKTTLLASIYEMVARGSSSYSFAGSLSLIGFEARCFAATAASRRTAADTARTTRDTENQLLHMRVSRDDSTTDLLLADVSGEYAQDLVRYDEPGVYAPLLRAASHVLLLVDGGRLARPTERYGCLEEARTLIRALAEGELVRDGSVLTVVVTKGDALPNDDPVVTVAIAEIVTEARYYWPAAGDLIVKAQAVDSATGGDETGIPALLDVLVDAPAARQCDVTLPLARHTRASQAFHPHSMVLAGYQSARQA